MTTTLPAPAQTLLCPHSPPCPPADAVDHDAAHIVFTDPLMGFSKLCNGVITYADTGESLPDGRTIAPHRPEPLHGAGWGVAS